MANQQPIGHNKPLNIPIADQPQDVNPHGGGKNSNLGEGK